MDPISQAAFGASLSQSFATDKTKQLSALLIGALAGMAPDLDVLINSTDDPLLFLEYHRQFSHSLVFIPFGALLCALVFYPLFKWRKSTLSFAQIYLFSFLGYATHGLMDACTSYGTQLFWPFSNARYAWNMISIIDPLFTVPVIVLITLAAYRKRPAYARLCPGRFRLRGDISEPGHFSEPASRAGGLCSGGATRPPGRTPAGQTQFCQSPPVENHLRV